MPAFRADNNGQELRMESVTWGNLTWMNFENPTVHEIEYLSHNYPFHPLDMDDCLSRVQRPKVDEYKDYLFIVLHFPVLRQKTGIATGGQLSIFLGKDYVITLHKGDLEPLNRLFRECQVDEELLQNNFSRGSGFLAYRIIDGLVDYWFPFLDRTLKQMDDVEDTVFDEEVEAAQELALLRRNIIAQRRIIWPLRAVIGTLETKIQKFTRIDMKVYFGDVLDHTDKIWDTLEEMKEIIEVFKDSDYVLSTDRLNRVVRILTVLSSIILPFLLVSSIYGMNIPLPGGLEKGSLSSFLILLALMCLIAGGMLFTFHRRRWI